MIDPATTIRRLLGELTQDDTQSEHQAALVANEEAIAEVTKFASWVTQAAMRRATERGADVGAALMVGSESSIVAVLLLGMEYGRILERDESRSLEDLLADLEGGADNGSA